MFFVRAVYFVCFGCLFVYVVFFCFTQLLSCIVFVDLSHIQIKDKQNESVWESGNQCQLCLSHVAF